MFRGPKCKERKRRNGAFRLLVLLAVGCLAILGSVGCKKGPSESTLRERSTHAQTQVRRIYDSSVDYFQTPHATATGDIVPRQFPRSVDPTPPLSALEEACEQGNEGVPLDPDYWEQDTWRDLIFAVSEPSFYSYQYDSSGIEGESRFTVSAFGDLDCDGTFSTFVRTGHVEGGEVQGSEPIIENELE